MLFVKKQICGSGRKLHASERKLKFSCFFYSNHKHTSFTGVYTYNYKFSCGIRNLLVHSHNVSTSSVVHWGLCKLLIREQTWTPRRIRDSRTEYFAFSYFTIWRGRSKGSKLENCRQQMAKWVIAHSRMIVYGQSA